MFFLPSGIDELYIVRFLHQTTTSLLKHFFWIVLYIVRFLHQTTTYHLPCRFVQMLYIVRFLHQTTTDCDQQLAADGCISSVSYIKPQLLPSVNRCCDVVYRPFPTSNHNFVCEWHYNIVLYIVRFLHQTTTFISSNQLYNCCISSVSYIKPQLHQAYDGPSLCCISSVSYIKPQQ